MFQAHALYTPDATSLSETRFFVDTQIRCLLLSAKRVLLFSSITAIPPSSISTHDGWHSPCHQP